VAGIVGVRWEPAESRCERGSWRRESVVDGIPTGTVGTSKVGQPVSGAQSKPIKPTAKPVSWAGLLARWWVAPTLQRCMSSFFRGGPIATGARDNAARAPGSGLADER